MKMTTVITVDVLASNTAEGHQRPLNMADALSEWWHSGKAHWDFLKAERAYQWAFSQKPSSLLLYNMEREKNKCNVKSSSEEPIHVTYSATLFGSQFNYQTIQTTFSIKKHRIAQ